MLNRCQYFIPTVLMVDTGLDHLPLTPWAESQSFTWCLDLTTAVESNWLRPPQKKTKHDQHGVHLLYLQGSRVLHLHPTHVDLGAVDFQKSLPYTKQAPPCYDMLQPCFLFVPKERHPGGISKAMKVQFCRTLPSFSGLPRLTTVMSWTAQLSLVASVRTAEGGISYRRILDM